MESDPYEEWLHIPPGPRPPSPDVLLGVPPDETDWDRIFSAAMNRAEIVRRYVLGPHGEAASQILYEIARAVHILETRLAEGEGAPSGRGGDSPAPVAEGIPVDAGRQGPAEPPDAAVAVHPGPAAVPRKKARAPAGKIEVTPGKPAAIAPPRGRSVEQLRALLQGAESPEQGLVLSSISGERDRQRKEKEEQEATVLVVTVSAAVAVAMVLIWALFSLRGGTEQTATNRTGGTRSVQSAGASQEGAAGTSGPEDKHGAKAGRLPAGDGGAAPSPDSSKGPSGDQASLPSAPSEAEDGGKRSPSEKPAEPLTSPSGLPNGSKPAERPAKPSVARGALAGLDQVVDLPLVASPSSGFWARGEPVRLGQIDLEPAQALEFTVTGSTDALAGLCRGELQFVVEPTKSTPASTASDEREASWTVHLRGNVQQYSRFPDDPLKDAFVYHDRHVGTIWWEDRELLFAWHAEQDPFFLQRTLARREALGFSVLADSLRFCQLHVRAGEQSRSITLVRPRRLTPVRIDPMSGGTSESIDLAALPRPPGRWNYQTQFTRISGVRLEYSIGATDGQASWNRPQLVFHQLTTDRTAAELNLEATFQLTGEMSRDDKSSLFFVSCRPVSPTASEYQSVRDKRSRNIVERQYLRFAVNTQGRTVVHYRLFLQLGTRFVEVGRTEVEP